MKIQDRKGFTLVELLVVIAIIGILAISAVPSLFKHIESAKIAALEKDINAVKYAVESFYISKGKYPITKDYIGKDTDIILKKNMYEAEDENGNANNKISEDTKEIMSEIENLQFPFNASYQITYLTGNTSPTEIGYNLYIKINLPKDSISERGKEKLIKDLSISDKENLVILVIKGEKGDY